ncbi:unnamed protein product [Pleuronectes platessa]|uniref:Uncharacterized protein n=1 Tax=Pleuronectes platessa TaxID=8262 RepID=A0A9N7U4C1_PLEPL|nr:unnamed protein product [Pleuronectes platessa]
MRREDAVLSGSTRGSGRKGKGLSHPSQIYLTGPTPPPPPTRSTELQRSGSAQLSLDISFVLMPVCQ